jgi:UDP-N-acetyl-D-glucosamine dehydrogenase
VKRGVFLLHEKILTGNVIVGVAGLGYVGLPLVILAGREGFLVIGIDQDVERVDSLCKGKSYIPDIPDKDVRQLLDRGLIRVSTDYNNLTLCDVIVVCVPTPLTADRRPDYSYIESAAAEIASILRPGQLVIIESTVAPGTTDAIILPLLQSSGLRAGTDFFLSYSPERIDPGNKTYSLSNIPKIVSGLTPACQILVRDFYEMLGLTVVPVRTLATAEIIKLLENTYRDVNIALINEMTQICRGTDIDIWEVIDGAATKPFGFQPFYPGPGVGGHCVPVDSVYYTSWARASGTPAKLAELARRVNTDMTQFVTGIITGSLQDEGKTVTGSEILFLGVSYKKDIHDVRESSVIRIIEWLKKEGAIVNFHDPFINSIRVGSEDLQGIALDERNVSRQDCVVLSVAHSAFNLIWLYQTSRLIVDLTNAMAKLQDNKLKKL